MTKNKVGFNTVDKIPEGESFFLSGDFSTVKAGSNYINYRSSVSSAWYSALIKTYSDSLIVSASDTASLADILSKSIELIKLKKELKALEQAESTENADRYFL